jgi:hypothetical protein
MIVLLNGSETAVSLGERAHLQRLAQHGFEACTVGPDLRMVKQSRPRKKEQKSMSKEHI